MSLQSVPAEPVALVPIASDGAVRVVDLATGTLAGSIPVATGPIGAAVDAGRHRLYVVHQIGDQVTEIDTLQRRVVRTLPLPSDGWGIAVHPPAQRAYVAISGADQVGVIDTANLTLITTINVGDAPRDIVVSADGTRVYTADQNSGTFSVIDATTNTLLGTYAVGAAPLGLALSPDGSLLYLAKAFAGEVLRISTASHQVLGSTALMAGAAHIEVHPDGSRLYVSCTNADVVAVIDTSDHHVLTHVAVGQTPYGLELSADGSRLYVANVDSESVTVIDTAKLTVTGTIALMGAPFAVGEWLVPAGVPERPVITGSTAGDQSATLAFTAGYSGGGTPGPFIADCTPGNHSISVGASPLTLSGLSNNTLYRCTVKASSSVGESDPSEPVSVIPGLFGDTADLGISISNGTGHLIGGAPSTWQILVQNAGPAPVLGAQVEALLDDSSFSNGSWTCSSSDGGLCRRAAGPGSVQILGDLPAGSSLQLALTATPNTEPETPVSVPAMVLPPAGITDPQLANNAATDGPDTRGLLRDGFE